jgi:hypothetical protein
MSLANIGPLRQMFRVAWFLALVAVVLAHTPALSQSVEQAAGDAIRELGLQTTLPGDPQEAPWNMQLPAVLVWAVLICGLALVLYLCRDMLPIWRLWPGRGWQANGGPESTTAAQVQLDAAATADELGQQGRFAEAIHMLLILSLGEIRRHLGEHFAASLTSREILRGTRLPTQGHGCLRDIVARVEWTYFGGYPATADDYAACRQKFETLRALLRGTPGAVEGR